MEELLRNLLTTDSFIPHGHCYLWKPELVWLHLSADALTALAYYSIPVLLIYFVHQRRDLPFQAVFLLFGAFIIACGTTHVLSIWTLWHPTYWLSGAVKAVTAVVSLFTALELGVLMPKALALPSPAQLTLINQALEAEIVERQQAEQTLAAQAATLQKQAQLLELVHDTILVRDRQGQILFWNQEAEAMYGWSKAEVLDHDPHLLLKTQFPEPLEAVESALLAVGHWEGELTQTRRDGTPVVVTSRWALQRDDQGAPAAILELNTDISQRKQAELALQMAHAQLEARVIERTTALAQANQELSESEQRFRATFEQAAVGVGHVDIQGQWLRVNQKLCDIVGYNREELLGKTFQDITHPDDLNDDLKLVQQVLAGEIATYSMEKRYIRRDRSIVWVTLTVSLVRSATGEPKYFISVIEDISERRRAAAQWYQSLKELSDLKFALDQAAIVAVTDHRGVIHDVNEKFCELSQYSREELLGHTHRLINSGHHDSKFFQDLWAVIAQGKVWHGEIKNRAKDGTYYWVDTTIVPFLNERDKPFQYLAIRFDITSRKRIEEQIKTSLHEKEVLLKEIHHRVKNNLQIISSLLSLQAEYLKDSEVLAIFKDSQNRINSMALIHEKLYQSKDLARINFSDYIHDLVASLLYTYDINISKVVLKIEADEILLGIDTAIPCGLIINELVLNALKYAFPGTEKGEVYVGLRSLDDCKYTLTVQDDGVGLPEGLDFRNTESLGLQLVNALVNQLGGTIAVENLGGVKFEISFSE